MPNRRAALNGSPACRKCLLLMCMLHVEDVQSRLTRACWLGAQFAGQAVWLFCGHFAMHSPGGIMARFRAQIAAGRCCMRMLMPLYMHAGHGIVVDGLEKRYRYWGLAH